MQATMICIEQTVSYGFRHSVVTKSEQPNGDEGDCGANSVGEPETDAGFRKSRGRCREGMG